MDVGFNKLLQFGGATQPSSPSRSLRRPTRLSFAAVCLALAAVFAGTPASRAEEPAGKSSSESRAKESGVQADLIPREKLFGNPDKAMARISPDGKRLAYLAPVDGVLNVHVGPIDDPAAARPVTKDTKRGIRSYFWAFTNQHIVYRQDVGGDEDWHVYAVDLDTLDVKDLTPLENVSAQIEQVSWRFPEEILVGLNDRDESLHDIYKVNLLSGERELVQENPGFAGFVTDEDYAIRFGQRFEPDGGTSLHRMKDGQWQEYLKIPYEDSLTTGPAGFDRNGLVMYFMDSRGRDTSALTSIDLRDGKTLLIAQHDKADVSGVLSHPTDNTIRGVAFEYLRKEWTVLDDAVQADLAYLRTLADGDIEIPSMTLDDKHWIVAYLMDNGALRYYHYDREKKQARFLFTNRADLQGLPLVNMHPLLVRTRDDMQLVCYLSLPPGSDSDGDGRPDRPLPLVLNVHGGPWARDTWGYDPEHQWLANRGYAVLSVNFRGSTGFGKNYLNAGQQQWGADMHNDLIDAVDWAVAEKIAQADKVAIMGGSYGGYATLAGLTFTPDKFACGVDIVGPSNLLTLLSTIPPYWKPVLQMFKNRVGDPDTEEGRKLLEERSPLNYVERIKRPLLIAQGANDPRVKQSEADQIVKAMEERNIPVTYVLYPDEGHGFARPQNRMSFYAVTEAFLSEHLGGRFQPVGDDFAGSSIQVPSGADGVPGLPKALKKHQAALEASEDN